jgi:hypothetical protein
VNIAEELTLDESNAANEHRSLGFPGLCAHGRRPRYTQDQSKRESAQFFHPVLLNTPYQISFAKAQKTDVRRPSGRSSPLRGFGCTPAKTKQDQKKFNKQADYPIKKRITQKLCKIEQGHPNFSEGQGVRLPAGYNGEWHNETATFFSLFSLNSPDYDEKRREIPIIVKVADSKYKDADIGIVLGRLGSYA